MNTTNRPANRAFLAVVGLLLLAAGAAAVLIAAVPAVAAGWRTASAQVRTQAPGWLAAPTVGRVGWLAIAVGVVAVALALVLVAFVVRQGRGHASTVLERRIGPQATTRIDLAVPRALLTDRLAGRPELLATRVTAYTVRGTPVLKVSVRARRGTSPKAVSDLVLAALHELDAVLGERLPAYVQISGGFRARTTARARVA